MSPLTVGILLFVVTLLGVSTWKAPRLTSVILWSLVAAILFGAVLLLTLPFEFRSLALWLSLAVPLIWLGFQFFCYWDKKGWRVASALITISIVSGVIVAMVPAPV